MRTMEARGRLVVGYRSPQALVPAKQLKEEQHEEEKEVKEDEEEEEERGGGGRGGKMKTDCRL